MKVIVKTENEMKLMKRFIKALTNDSLLDVMREQDHLWANEYNEDNILESEEYRFIEDSLSIVKLEIDEKEYPMTVEDDHIITGKCSVCGEQTEGSIDGGAVDYDEYLRLTSKEVQNDWLCESCYFTEEDE